MMFGSDSVQTLLLFMLNDYSVGLSPLWYKGSVELLRISTWV